MKRSRTASLSVLPAAKRYKRTYKKKPSALTQATKLGIEKKAITYSGVAALPTGLANARIDLVANTPLNGIAQGDGHSQRDGRKVTLASVHVNGVINVDTQYSTTVRVAIVMDKYCNGTALDPIDVFDDQTTSYLDICAFRNLDNVQRFDVIHDETFDICPDISNNGATQLNNYASHHFKINKKLSEVVNYSDTSAVIGSIADKALYLLIWSSRTGQYNVVSRVRYYG